MPELRFDPLIGRWVIFSPERGKRPNDFISHEETHPAKNECPFCEGHEKSTPPEITAFRSDSTLPDTPGWSIRVVSNKFPALVPEGEFQTKGEGVYLKSPGVGAHEVIIETPEHHQHLEEQNLEGIANVFKMYQQRIEALLKDSRFEYVLVFKNVGKEAGASLEHPHSQLIATPVTPKRIQEKLEEFQAYYKRNKKSIFLEIIAQELKEKTRIVYENEAFLSFCPYASKFPFQIMTLPKLQSDNIQNLSTQEMHLFADCVKVTLTLLARALKKPQYNIILNVGPKNEIFHWHLDIMPRMTKIAGFEWGSDFYINPVLPETAAQELRSQIAQGG